MSKPRNAPMAISDVDDPSRFVYVVPMLDGPGTASVDQLLTVRFDVVDVLTGEPIDLDRMPPVYAGAMRMLIDELERDLIRSLLTGRPDRQDDARPRQDWPGCAIRTDVP